MHLVPLLYQRVLLHHSGVDLQDGADSAAKLKLDIGYHDSHSPCTAAMPYWYYQLHAIDVVDAFCMSDTSVCAYRMLV